MLTATSALSQSALSEALILGSGSCGRGSHSIGLDTQKAGTLALRRKRRAQSSAFGQVVSLCRGTTGLADGGGRPSQCSDARSMRTRNRHFCLHHKSTSASADSRNDPRFRRFT